MTINLAPSFSAQQLSTDPGADWITNGGAVNNQRYSTLNQINSTNVGSLKEAWHIHLNSGKAAKYSAEGTPIVYQGVMYMVTGNDDAFALDATTGQQLWEYHSNIDQTISTACCGWDNRGLALGGGLVYDAQLDGTLVALNQQTGIPVWHVPVFNWREGVTLTSAPLYYNGVVYVGSTGGEFGFRGSVSAYDATNGNFLWRFFTVPQPGDIGGQTWAEGPLGFETGGATVWNTPSVDPQQNMIVFSTGNAAPWSSRGPGQNLFTSSYVALNATTGQLKWWYQVVHHDIWDYDCPAPTVQFDININGTLRNAIAEPCKTGWVYELDRTNGTPLIGIPEKKVPQMKTNNTWPTQPVPVGQAFDSQCAKKSSYTGKASKIGGHPVKVGCIWTPYDTKHAAAMSPSAQGGSDWNSPSYNPNTQFMYVCSADSDFSLLGVPAATLNSSYIAGAGFFGVTFGGIHFYGGHVTAMNMTNNRIAWDVKYHSPCYSGTFTTAGNLVFAGQVNGEYDAFDATTGKQLWSTKLDAGVAAPGMTYSVNGKQYVAIYAGGATFSFEAVKPDTFPHGDSLYVFALPEADRKAGGGTGFQPARRPYTSRAIKPRNPSRRGSCVSRKLRIGVIVVVSLAVVAGSLIGFLASHARAATDRAGATPKKYTAAATLKAVAGSHARGTFSGQVTGTTSGTSGTLRWKVTYTGLSGPVTGVLLKQGAKVLAHLCSSSCKSGVQKSTGLHGATFRAAVANKTTVAVATKAHATGELTGALRLKATSPTTGGGGGTTVAVTPAAVAAGKKLVAHFSCTGCHTIDGTKSTGPTWKGLAGSKVPQTDGTTVIATDAYLIRVITDPSTLKVKGYDSGVMSEVIAPGTVSDAEARNIVAYIKSLK